MPDERRVLVVEDEAMIRESLSTMLAEEGYAVQVARDGQEALAVLERWQPDVILLDLMMPVLDGRGFRSEQRRRPSMSDIPVIVISGAREVRAAAADLGACAAISKPFDVDDVLRILGRHFEERSTA